MIETHGTDSDYLTDSQIAQLLRAINPRRVGTYEKTSKIKLAHVEAYELRAHLNRILGFARWSEEVLDQQLVFATSEERARDKQDASKGTYTVQVVAYRSIVRLSVCAPSGKLLAVYTEGAVGDAQLPSLADAHDMALKTSESQAFKRCCANLGDQFGLSLYRKGDRAALVKQTLLRPDVAPAAEGVDDEVAEHVAEDETVDAQPDPRSTSATQPPAEPAAQAPAEPAQPAEPVEPAVDPRLAVAERIRTDALGPVPPSYSPQKWIAHLMGEAVKNKCQAIPVEGLDTATPVALRVFLEDALKRAAGQRASA